MRVRLPRAAADEQHRKRGQRENAGAVDNHADDLALPECRRKTGRTAQNSGQRNCRHQGEMKHHVGGRRARQIRAREELHHHIDRGQWIEYAHQKKNGRANFVQDIHAYCVCRSNRLFASHHQPNLLAGGGADIDDAHHPPAVEDGDAVSQAEQLVQIFADQQHRDPGGLLIEQTLAYCLGRAYVQPLCRMGRDDQLRVRRQFAGQNQLLQIPTGEGACVGSNGGRVHVELGHQLRAHFVQPGPESRNGPGLSR